MQRACRRSPWGFPFQVRPSNLPRLVIHQRPAAGSPRLRGEGPGSGGCWGVGAQGGREFFGKQLEGCGKQLGRAWPSEPVFLVSACSLSCLLVCFLCVLFVFWRFAWHVCPFLSQSRAILSWRGSAFLVRLWPGMRTWRAFGPSTFYHVPAQVRAQGENKLHCF